MTTFTSFDQIGKREDVEEIITNIDPTTTPFQTMITRGRVTNDLYQWQEDSLAAVRDNAAVEGADATTQTLIPTVLRANRTQILEKTIRISGTADAIDLYGRPNETAYQSQKAALEIKRDMESQLIGRSQNAAAGDAASVPRRFGNLIGNDANGDAIINTRTPAGTFSSATPSPTAGAPLAEEDVLGTHQTLFENGSDPTILMITPKDSEVVAGFAQSAGRERDFGSTKTVVNVVDLYVSPYGELRVVLNRFLQRFIPDDGVAGFGETVDPTPTNDGDTNPDQLGIAVLMDPDMFELSTLRPFTRTELARDGDSRKFQLLGEYGFKHANYLDSALIVDLS